MTALLVLSFTAQPVVGHGDANRSPFVSPSWLAQRLKNPSLVIFHIGVKAEYDTVHIPGAQFLQLNEITTRTPEGITFELPSVAYLDSVFESKGVSDNSTIVLYFFGNNWVTPTTRVYFTLDYLGAGNRTFILNGGLRPWRAQGRPVTSAVPKPHQKSP